MLDIKENNLEDEESEYSEDEQKQKKSKKKNSHQSKDDGQEGAAREHDSDNDEEDEDDEDERPAAFFARKERKPEAEDGREHSGLTEDEVQEAFQAIIDGLGRELREEFEAAEDSTLAELQAIAAASFIDSLREKIEEGGRDITEDVLDEALQEALEGLLGVEESTRVDGVADEATVDQNNATAGATNSPSTPSVGGGGSNPGSGGGGSGLGTTVMPNPPSGSAAVAAFIAANSGAANTLPAEAKDKRGRGLLIGGIVGYLLGRRHGRKRAESQLQPEVEKLETQVNDLYEAIATREHILRRVVLELQARQLGSQHSTNLQLQAHTMLHKQTSEHEVSKKIQPPSLVIPAVFATLLVASRLKADISNEKHTWGKDFVVGGTAGYMIGRRHGRKKTETRLKTEIELLEQQVSSLNTDLVTRDSVIDAMVKVVAEADNSVASNLDAAQPHVGGMHNKVQLRDQNVDDQRPPNAASKEAQEFVDASIDRIALYRKNREIKRHREHLLKSGRASAVGEFNLGFNVFLERRLIDGNENSPERKQIEIMDEGELLAMSQNIYVDGESAIDLYEKGRLELEILRESVKQYWRKTGDYEQTLRTNLKADNSMLSDIRANLESAYRTILEQS